MYNQKLVRLLKLALVGLLAIVLVSLGYAGGAIHQRLSTAKVDKVETSRETLTSDDTRVDTLTTKTVRDFLIAYYTKTDLEENRSRYKPFMTDSLYQVLVAEEDKPVSQAYKGYIVDQVFTEAVIYIDQENLAAIVQVSYENTLLQEKDNRAGQATKQRATLNLKLKYLLQDDQLLLSQMEPIVLTDNNQAVLTTYQDTNVLMEDVTEQSEEEKDGN